MKRLFIIGASILQLPAIKKAKEMGLYVGVADFNPQAIGIPYADEYFNVSTIDEEGIYQAAKEFKADGIMTLATDMPMRSLAYACDKLGLVGIPYDTAVKSTDKAAMIEAFEKQDVAHPWYYVIHDLKDMDTILDKVSYPCITKPTDNSGSRGIMTVHNKAELKSALSYSSSNGRTGEVIVEELMVGQEVSVEVVVYKGVPHVLQITDKLTTGAPHFVEMGHSQPTQLGEKTVEAIHKLAFQAVKAVGIHNGPAHLEMMVTENGPKMIELGARMGGDCITTHLVPLSNGVDMVKATIQIALGEEPDLTIKEDKCAVIRFLPSQTGQIKEISGIEDAKKVVNITHVEFMKQVGDTVGDIESSVDRIGYVIAQSDNFESAIQSCETAMNKLIVIVKGETKLS